MSDTTDTVVWKKCVSSKNGEPYYFNVVTGESQWKPPSQTGGATVAPNKRKSDILKGDGEEGDRAHTCNAILFSFELLTCFQTLKFARK
jgi:hypothetical protein